MMKAIVVRNFDEGPKFETNYPTPSEQADEVIINVLSSSLSNRARSSATGQHYTATGKLPMVPGIDGVGTLPNGKKVYFVADGSFAEQVAVEKGHWVELPSSVNDSKVAGLMNPALSAWMALKYRVNFKKHQKVMILGASGNAGKVAIQVAQRLGAGEIVAVGRHIEQAELSALGATQVIELDQEAAMVKQALALAGQDIDVVLDYLWGEVTANAMWAIIPHRNDDEQELKWVSIGTAAGQTASLPGAAFRAVKLQLIGSGQGSIGVHDIIKSFKEILQSESQQPFSFVFKQVPLDDFEEAWQEKGTKRIVFEVRHSK
ncbi:zinc-binding alcohol dehydrogenase family protein [Furfurilactobacillus curtus]|uniref:NADPH:quinone reductase n=1 Tax=Furfurilactobacillus curtus TaxID=1746200 RepID=A0ABQ5JSS2_9LACO